jgi:hypothetical protein
LEIIEK